ncbi:MAG: hypothetical protein R3344_10145, partial [Acidobacteriota bacterium]|nr:hypothetical protein [Acidobacteriota bacterium]
MLGTILKRRAVTRFAMWAVLLALPPAVAAEGDLPAPYDPDAAGPLGEVDRWLSPAVDVERLLVEDEANRNRQDIPLRIGYPMTTDLSPSARGTWEDLPGGGQLWRLKVASEGARWLVLGFDRFALQPGGELRVLDPARETVLGPYTHKDIRSHRELWFPPIAGEVLVVELFWPESLRGTTPDVHLGTVSHGYKAFGAVGRDDVFGPGGGGGGGISPDDVGDSGSCNIDVNCPLGDAWQDQKRGVVVLLSGGFAFCTGSLINTTADDCRPYVLTADHCGPGPSTTFGFNFEWEGCGPGGPTPVATNQTVTGATVLAEFSGSDFSLLEMDSAPPEAFDVYYNGWTRSATPATESFGIHHPSGDVKKISHNMDPLVDGQNWGPDHWRVTEWELGTTEPGSSGSPMFDQNQRIVGQLHGGTASCSSITYDEYGKVFSSWTGGGTTSTRLQDWLDPDATGATVMDGVD